MLSSCPEQVEFSTEQVTFHSHLPNVQRPRQVVLQLNKKIQNLKLAQGKENLTADCLKGKLEFKFFQPFRGVDIFSHALYPSPFSLSISVDIRELSENLLVHLH